MELTRFAFTFLTSVAFFAVVFSLSEAANPVKTPIIQDAAFVHTREFAQIPEEDGKPAKIICMVPNGIYLYVCTLTAIYQVSYFGTVSVFLDVRAAIELATDRKLDTTSKIHGGVRSIAFPAGFAASGLIYISAMETRPKKPSDFWYVSDVPDPIRADSVLLEFKFNRFRRTVNPRSYRCVFRVGMPVYDHTIRQIAFYRNLLYIAHGDGSEQDATVGGGQNGDARGKILRIRPTKPRKGRRPYSIPNGNPFVRNPNMPDEVWALGFRNPHHLCFGRDGTLYVADTGRSNVEEVNLVTRGGNYGWSLREGTFVHTGSGIVTGVSPLPADDIRKRFVYPAAQVGHEGSVGAGFVGQAIAGGCPVENGSPMDGRYWYADFPRSGRLFFSKVDELKRAITRGRPSRLTQARTSEAVVCLTVRIRGRTRVRRVGTLGGAVRADAGLEDTKRVDVRLGRGRFGELLWSSKTNGKLYVLTSSYRYGSNRRC